MGELTFILGGARSGKSSYAERLALQHGGQVLYVATAQPLDDEMVTRINTHQKSRPIDWQTLEISANVGRELVSSLLKVDVILVDCLTLLVSNLLMSLADGEDGNALIDERVAGKLVDSEIARLLEAVQSIPADWIVVSNEVGLGLVPPFPLGRIYRDLLGRANQRVATQATQVIFMIAGIAMRLAPL